MDIRVRVWYNMYRNLVSFSGVALRKSVIMAINRQIFKKTAIALIILVISALILAIGAFSAGSFSANANTSANIPVFTLGAWNTADSGGSGGEVKIGEYINGACVTRAPIIGFALEKDSNGRLVIGSMNVPFVQFQYAERETIGVPSREEDWIPFGDWFADPDTGELEISSSFFIGGREFYKSYIYFRAVFNNSISRVTFICEEFLNLVVDSTANPDNYSIASVTATYESEFGDAPLPYNKDTHPWVGGAITFRITTKSPNTPVNIIYTLEGSVQADGTVKDPEWLYNAVEHKDEFGVTYYTVTVNETFSGDVIFASQSVGGDYTTAIIEHYFTIRVDLRYPAFRVSAYMLQNVYGDVTLNPEYKRGSVSPVSVRYVVTQLNPFDEHDNEITDPRRKGSDAKFFVSTGERNLGEFVWHEMERTGTEGNYVYFFTANQSLPIILFRGESSAGKCSTKDPSMNVSEYSFEARIDTRTPQINVTATDATSTAVRPLGTVVGDNSKVGYATDRVNFRIQLSNTSAETRNIYTVSIHLSRDGGASYELIGNINPSNPGAEVTIVFNAPVIGGEFLFEARSSAHIPNLIERKSSVNFGVSVLKSGYQMVLHQQPNINFAIWQKDAIELYFRVPNLFTNHADAVKEYSFHRRVAGASGDTGVRVDNAEWISFYEENEERFSVFKVLIDISLNSERIEFYARDGARNISNAYQTPLTRLDLEVPKAEINSYLYGDTTNKPLGANDWASGRVEIRLTPLSENISGLRCFVWEWINYSDGRGLKAQELPLVGGQFVYSIALAGTYWFIVESGAGHFVHKSTVINIDSSQITFDEIKVFGLDWSGTLPEEKQFDTVRSGITFTLTNKLGAGATVEFETNQKGRFTFYWEMSNSIQGFTGDYTHETNREHFIINPSLFPQLEGTVFFAFVLESRAVDRFGTKSESERLILRIDYDLEGFSIALRAQTDSGWQFEPIEFRIDIISATDISISAFQFRLIPNSGAIGNWRGADRKESNPNSPWHYEVSGQSIYFTFAGVDYGLPHMPNVPQGSAPPRGFNGHLEFRAINTAGTLSDNPVLTQQEVLIDDSVPNPFYAIVKTGEIVHNLDIWEIHSFATVRYENPRNSASSPLRHYAPVDYYFMPVADSPTVPSPIDIRKEEYLLSQTGANLAGEFYVFAQSVHISNRFSDVYRVRVVFGSVMPTATLNAVGGGAINVVTNMIEVDWSESATITIQVSSSTKVYVEYSIGNRTDWKQYRFEGDMAVDGTALHILFNHDTLINQFKMDGGMDATIYFRVRNLAGAYATFTAHDSVWVKMDVRTPFFRYDITNNDGQHLSASALSEWQNTHLFIRLFPVESAESDSAILDPKTANPGGVEYFYRVVTSAWSHEFWGKTPGDGTYLSTKADLGFNGIGSFRLYILARANKSSESYELYIDLKIDTVEADFDIIGEIEEGSLSNRRTITSGTWVAVDKVFISLKMNPLFTPVSEVKFHILETQDKVNQISLENYQDWNLATREINTLIRVYVAISSCSGKNVTIKYFDVNIDNVPPSIDGGGIVNALDAFGNIDRLKPNTYYIDRAITFVCSNLKYARYNNFPLQNGQVIGTNVVDNSNTGGIPGGKGGYVHIIVENMAGLRAELIFYMVPFELTVNTITTSPEHEDLLYHFEREFILNRDSLTGSRQAMFLSQINRLKDRVATLKALIRDYQAFLDRIDTQSLFTLIDDYPQMHEYINYFTTRDTSILYPKWLQDSIKEGDYARKFTRFEQRFDELHRLQRRVNDVQSEVAQLPATNIVARSDYSAILTVYNAYQSLNDIQKGVFLPTYFNKLQILWHEVHMLRLQVETEDGTISIDGDNLAGTASLVVSPKAKTAEFGEGVQRSLLESFSAGVPRAVIFITELGLEGIGSEANTGTVRINLPIPEEFRNYKNFTVYRVTTDISITAVSVAHLDAGGNHISFSVANLYHPSSIFVLAVEAEVDRMPASTLSYGSIGDIEIDGTLLMYITYSASAMFVMLLAVVIFMGVKHRAFLKKYNKSYKRSLQARGISEVPKGNPEARSNPKDMKQKFKYD